MAKQRATDSIRLRGVRHNNLRGFDLDLPTRRLIVVTGPSGSGKSSLAFDTLFAEGQRRYVETFSPYARQFFDRMDKPRVDSIEGIPPAIAIEQRNSVRTTRSTVGTMTELCEYLKLLWPHLAVLYCRGCGRPVVSEPPQRVWEAVPREGEALITFDLELSDKLSLAESVALVQRQGYQRFLEGAEVVRVEEAAARWAGKKLASLTVIQDRVRLASGSRARFVEACEQAYHFGKGRLAVRWEEEGRAVVRRFSQSRHCAACDLGYREPVPAMFSFNHPLGACPTCRGFGRTITIDYRRALPDRGLTLAGGVVRPWQTATGAECQRDLMRFCRASGIRTDVPFEALPEEHQRWVVEGDADYGKDEEHEWPRAWYGVKGYFRYLESKAYKMHVRVLLSRYRAYVPCADCAGKRFQPESLLYQVGAPDGQGGERRLTLADFQQLTVTEALGVARFLEKGAGSGLGLALQRVLQEVQSRLGFLEEVGLGYLTLERPTRSLSGGETERVNLTTCLGTRLVNTLYVLDEPSVGLHARDTVRLVRILERLRDLGNTVVVVEHEAAVMRAADQVVDLGPGHGEAGGQLVFQGDLQALMHCEASLTGAYLAGRRQASVPRGRAVRADGAVQWLSVRGATRHNLRGLDVDLPLGRLVCLTGVSGSGKSTLVRDVLHPLLAARFSGQPESAMASEGSEDMEGDEVPGEGRLEGWQALSQVVLVDQSPVGRTPRSNPAVYVGAFDFIREVFADSEAARQRGLGASAFSFNSAQGQCDRCRGAGFEKIEMQFLSDVFIRCPVCEGRRYRSHVLDVRVRPPLADPGSGRGGGPGRNIAEVLDSTVDEAIGWLGGFELGAARRGAAALRWLQKVGLGYLRLGQPINTLSGGESQRLKIVGHLAVSALSGDTTTAPTLFLLDEPTTGLHFDDVRVLVEALQGMVDAGHSVVVIEHNLDVIRSADWIIDLGPDAGDDGGRIVVEGTLDQVLACAVSHTAAALRADRVAPLQRG